MHTCQMCLSLLFITFFNSWLNDSSFLSSLKLQWLRTSLISSGICKNLWVTTVVFPPFFGFVCFFSISWKTRFYQYILLRNAIGARSTSLFFFLFLFVITISNWFFFVYTRFSHVCRDDFFVESSNRLSCYHSFIFSLVPDSLWSLSTRINLAISILVNRRTYPF